jgi:hypothetical protein
MSSPPVVEHPKIKRAQKHLKDFYAACSEFVKTKPYTITKQPEKHQGRGIKIEFDPSPPELGLIFGDFVHNLRSALDHVVRDLAFDYRDKLPRYPGRSHGVRSAFPILTHGNQWANTPGCQDGGFEKVCGIVPDAITAIERLQPYHAVGDVDWQPLTVLSRLDNRDKHRELNLAISYVSHVGGRTDSGWWFGPPPNPQTDTMVEAALSKMDMDYVPTLGIALSSKGPAPRAILWEEAKRSPLMLTLLGISDQYLLPDILLASVVGIVRVLETHLSRPPTYREGIVPENHP